ncbi:malate/lactate dehydrogenase [Clostridium saccharobutylicum]|nr:malate/lactate dehydrogenase [Clostridium saccharobutylicum]
MKDNQKRVGNVDLDKLVLDTARAGWEVYNRKGTTYYGIAAATVGIIKAIMYNENKIIPVSTLLEGEYGENDIFCGVPVVLNADGVKEVVEIHMADDELDKFKKSVQLIREYTEKIK